MPKTKGVQYNKNYTEEALQRALSEIAEGASKKSVSRKYGIPRATIQFRLSDKFTKSSHGPPPVLSETEESLLVDWIINCSKKGFPQRKEDLQASVKSFLDEHPRSNPFKNNFPGDGWYHSFLRRHPILSVRQPESVTSASSTVAENDIRGWFSKIEEYLRGENLFEVLSDPTRVFNSDETCFQVCPKTKNVLAQKGSQNVYEIDRGQAKLSITVLFTFSAAGETTPPLIVYPYKRLPTEIMASVPKKWGIGISSNGWMKTEIFSDYIENIFHKHLSQNNVKFPVILFVDGHSSHVTYRVSQLCSELQIILIALYPNSTRILQPADVSCFKPMKNLWKMGVLKWRRENPSIALTKENFAPILEQALTYFEKNNVISGFRCCGLYPWDPNALDYTKCLGKNNSSKNEATEMSKSPSEKNTISFGDFKSIIGEERLRKLELMEDLDRSGDFAMIYEIYKKFKKPNDERLDEHCTKEDENKQDATKNNELRDKKLGKIIGQIDETRVNNTKVDTIEEREVQDTGNTLEYGTYIDSDPSNINNNAPYPDYSVNSTMNDDPNESFQTLNIEDIPIVFEFDDQHRTTLKSSAPSGNPRIEEFPVLIKKTPIIKDYVQWFPTPERKGIKRTEKNSFALTSQEWLQEKLQKENKKKQIEAEKEERKRKRLEKAQEKNNNKENAKKPKNTKVTRTKAPVLNKRVININKPLEVAIPPKINIISDFSITPVKPPHVRKLIFHSGDEQKYSTESDFIDFGKHERLLKGLCFICTKNINAIEKGIKCDQCSRTFHPPCIRKQNNMPPTVRTFVCNACVKKTTSMSNM